MCVSLLSSMFHAAAMTPPASLLHLAVTAQDHEQSQAHCHESMPEPQSKAANCDLGGHVCCVGVAVVTAQAHASGSQLAGRLINPKIPQLHLRQSTDRLFKPPKHFIHIARWS